MTEDAEAMSEALGGGGPVSEVEVISEPLEMGETMMLGLRLLDGVSGEGFRERFGKSLGIGIWGGPQGLRRVRVVGERRGQVEVDGSGKVARERGFSEVCVGGSVGTYSTSTDRM